MITLPALTPLPLSLLEVLLTETELTLLFLQLLLLLAPLPDPLLATVLVVCLLSVRLLLA
jgi:hypothetical protein